MMTSSVPDKVGMEQGTLRRRGQLTRRSGFATLAYLLATLVGLGIVGEALSGRFLTSDNVRVTAINASVVAVLAVGQFFVIVTGGIDLSVGSIAALSSVILGLALNAGIPMPLAVILTLGAATGVGALNGAIIVFARITPFIATLAMLSVASGLAYAIEGTDLVAVLNPSFLKLFNGRLGPIPTPVAIPVLIVAVGSFVMSYSAFGRRLYALGGNREASRLSGLPVQRDSITVYTISGLLAGLAGVIITAQLTEGSAQLGTGYELNAIAAVVVGGASLAGGTGNPLTAVLGGLIIGVIVDIMNLMGLQSEPQLIITGAVILVAVFFTSGRGTQLVASTFKTGKRFVGRPSLTA